MKETKIRNRGLRVVTVAWPWANATLEKWGIVISFIVCFVLNLWG